MDRFWAKVDRRGDDECWPWLASTMEGYGYFDERPFGTGRAHRIAYMLLVGPIPAGLSLDHLCRNRGCVNPAHLEPVTWQVNLLRGRTIPAVNAAKTHCPAGHPYDEANTYWWRNQRTCRTCGTANARRYRAQRREQAAS